MHVFEIIEDELQKLIRGDKSAELLLIESIVADNLRHGDNISFVSEQTLTPMGNFHIARKIQFKESQLLAAMLQICNATCNAVETTAKYDNFYKNRGLSPAVGDLELCIVYLSR